MQDLITQAQNYSKNILASDSCPYCGHTANIYLFDRNAWAVQCNNCGCLTPEHDSFENAIASWQNLRRKFITSKRNHVDTAQFIAKLKKYNCRMRWHKTKHFFLFDCPDKNIRDNLHEYFSLHPELECALRWQKLGLGFECSDDSARVHKKVYEVSYLWELPHDNLDFYEQMKKNFFDDVINWLSAYGGQTADLPGAVHYLTFTNKPRDYDYLCEGNKYPKSFPVWDDYMRIINNKIKTQQ